MLRTLMHELDQTVFATTLDYVMSYLESDEDTIQFHKYYQSYCKSAENWSYAHRVGCKINTNNHLESMHRTIKTVYFDRKHSNSLFSYIKILMKFIRDKLFDKLIQNCYVSIIYYPDENFVKNFLKQNLKFLKFFKKNYYI